MDRRIGLGKQGGKESPNTDYAAEMAEHKHVLTVCKASKAHKSGDWVKTTLIS